MRLALEGRVRALVTAPISKKALIDGAGFSFPGHTEFLAHLAGAGRVVMMLAGPDLRVVPATIHIPLAEVPGALTEALIVETVEITARALARDFGVPAPRIALAGLNPHAGEGGAIGHEEIEIIAPAIAALRARGHDVTGPLPADTMFHPPCPRPLRRGGDDVSRPGACAPEDHRLRRGCQRHARAALRAHLARPRHGIRHRRNRHRRRYLDDRRHPDGHAMARARE